MARPCTVFCQTNAKKTWRTALSPTPTTWHKSQRHVNHRTLNSDYSTSARCVPKVPHGATVSNYNFWGLHFTDLSNYVMLFQQGCRNHTDLNITICCCDSDLCNLPPEEKRNITDIDTSSGDNDKQEIIEIEVVEMNSTTNSTDLDESLASIADILDHPKFLRLPHAL